MDNLRYKLAVIKIGSSILSSPASEALDHTRIKNLVEDIVRIVKSKAKVVLVTSGAIAAGMSILKITKRPTTLKKLQACASVGQVHLMDIYNKYFEANEKVTAQVLLTKDDFVNRVRYLNAKNTLEELLDSDIIPIINENDAVSNEEIKFGDNDILSSLVANLIEADALMILTDVDGLYKCDEDGTLKREVISSVSEITKEIENFTTGLSSCNTSIGGMKSKIEAAKIVTKSGICCIIASGIKKDVIPKIFEGENIGTTFLPAKNRLSARKRWVAYSSKSHGVIKVDKGAKHYLVKKNKSLLGAGILSIGGGFESGDVVNIVDEDSRIFAKGISNYSSKDIEKIKGRKTSEIKDILGFKKYDEVIHRDNLVIL